MNREERRAHEKAVRKHQHKVVMKAMPDGTEIPVCTTCGQLDG